MAKICFAMFGRVLLGKVFCFWGGIFLQSAASHPFCYGDALRDIPYVDSALAKRFQKKRNDTWVVPYKHFFRYCHNPVSRSAPFKKSAPPAQTKTSPQDPHHQKGETKLRSSHGGGLAGKFGEVEGGLEGEGTPSERGFLLPPRSSSPYLLQDSPRTKRSRRKRSAGRTKVIIRTEETVPMPSRSPTVEIAFCVERK